MLSWLACAKLTDTNVLVEWPHAREFLEMLEDLGFSSAVIGCF